MGNVRKITSGFYGLKRKGVEGFVVKRSNVGWCEYIIHDGVITRGRTYQSLREVKANWK